MDNFELRALRPAETAEMEALLAREGLRRDARLDYSAGIFASARLVATGSCAGNTLRCLAVDRDFQGAGLLRQLVWHLANVQYRRGNFHLFLYTKPAAAHFFQDLGFTEIARDSDVVFLENQKRGFSAYLHQLAQESGPPAPADEPTGALVMNANPFTLGHQYLADQAAACCGTVHLFVVSEDVSVFPASDRMELVRAGTAHLKNLVYHQTGHYLISRATFPSYFLPDSTAAVCAQARLDAAVFCRIASALHITRRYLGTEPLSRTTALYNQALLAVLPPNGVTCLEIPRLMQGKTPVSASAVRQALKDGRWNAVEQMVPASTLSYLRSAQGALAVECLSDQKEVRHD